jgi:hypothetical protein
MISTCGLVCLSDSCQAALEDAFLESAKSSVIFSIIAREETMSQAAEQAFLAYLKGTDNRALMERVKVRPQPIQLSVFFFLLFSCSIFCTVREVHSDGGRAEREAKRRGERA